MLCPDHRRPQGAELTIQFHIWQSRRKAATQSCESTAIIATIVKLQKPLPQAGEIFAAFFFGGALLNEVYRQEKKYFMNLVEMQRLMGLFDQVMIQDPHNGARGYSIRSLYFDSLDERDYYQ